ncbi:MAG: hypothetical protein IH987_06245 [Planctomycetes bacterium]|nr:hypothetical protein [Planctomycetota bacterium]
MNEAHADLSRACDGLTDVQGEYHPETKDALKLLARVEEQLQIPSNAPPAGHSESLARP